MDIKPHYILVAAVTLDGKIARYSGHFPDWTSAEDKNHLHAIEDACDVLILGNTTYAMARHALTKRTCIVFTRSVQEPHQENAQCLYVNPSYSPLSELMNTYGYATACVLGGTHVYDFFLEHNLIDELYLTVEPLIFGKGLNLFEQSAQTERFKLETVKQLNREGTVVLHYSKKGSKPTTRP